jgi:hypothetical protein
MQQTLGSTPPLYTTVPLYFHNQFFYVFDDSTNEDISSILFSPFCSRQFHEDICGANIPSSCPQPSPQPDIPAAEETAVAGAVNLKMANDIQACEDLVANALDQEYPVIIEAIVTIGETPQKVLEGVQMSVFAQSMSGNQRVNMKLPSIRRALADLAKLGLGHSTTVGQVKYMFIKSMFIFKEL